MAAVGFGIVVERRIGSGEECHLCDGFMGKAQVAKVQTDWNESSVSFITRDCQDIEDREMVQLSCHRSYLYHYICLKKWVQTYSYCPYDESHQLPRGLLTVDNIGSVHKVHGVAFESLSQLTYALHALNRIESAQNN